MKRALVGLGGVITLLAVVGLLAWHAHPMPLTDYLLGTGEDRTGPVEPVADEREETGKLAARTSFLCEDGYRSNVPCEERLSEQPFDRCPDPAFPNYYEGMCYAPPSSSYSDTGTPNKCLDLGDCDYNGVPDDVDWELGQRERELRDLEWRLDDLERERFQRELDCIGASYC